MKDLKTIASAFSVKETVTRLIEKIEAKQWHVFAEIDHAKQAKAKGLELRPTQLILFGNPQVGTLLMQDRQTAAIDLPIKALIWEDDKGQVWISHNTINWLRQRHQLTDVATLEKLEDVLEDVCHLAAKN